jgi:protein required for attachment to host cells
MKLTWLVVADNSKARIFEVDSHSGPIVELETIVHTQSRLHEQDMTSDLPGRRSGGINGSGGNVYEAENSPKQQESINFAREVANEIEDGRKNNKFKQVMLVAAPGFLGNLRNALSVQTKKVTSFELAKNLSQLRADEIREHLPKRLPVL